MQPDPEPGMSFDDWLLARQHGLVRSAYLLTGDLHRAQDLVQDALVKVALRWDRLAASNPDAYVRTVLYRTNISWWRSRRETPVAEVRDTAQHVDHDATERAVMVTDALRRLTVKQRAVLVLRYFDDLTVAQTADALGVSTGTVKSQTAAALQRLRELAPGLEDLLGRKDEIR